MHFFHSIWKNLHLTENFYTDTVCGVCDKYEVCLPNGPRLVLAVEDQESHLIEAQDDPKNQTLSC